MRGSQSNTSPVDTGVVFERGQQAEPEIERLILGSILLDCSRFAEVAAILKAEDFAIHKHAILYSTIADMMDRGEPVDRFTLSSELNRKRQLETVDGMSYIISLDDGMPSIVRLPEYCRIVLSKSRLRTIGALGDALSRAALEGTQKPQDIINGLTAQIKDMAERLAADRGDSVESSRQVRSILDLQPISRLNFDAVEYLDSFQLLPKATIVALTGESGGGKSTFILWLAGRLIENGIPVLYLDRENPPAVVVERCGRLGVPDSINYWGTWEPEEASQPGSSIVRDWAESCDTKPVVIVDSAIAFMDGGDENDAAGCRKWFAPLRALASAGSTIVVLHHVGKGESSKDYRGSSDFKAAVDVGFLLTNWSPDGRLGTVRLNCWKSRFGFSDELVFHYRDGRFERGDYASSPVESPNERLTAFLRTNPGLSTRKFEQKAIKNGFSRTQQRMFLEQGVLSGAIEWKKFGTSGKAYYLVDDSSAPDLMRANSSESEA